MPPKWARTAGHWLDSLVCRLPQRHRISVSGRGEHPLAYHVRAKWWPPFAAVEFLAPRYRVEIVNRGEAMDGIRVQVAVTPYQGELGEYPHAPKQWREVVPYQDLGPLPANGRCVLNVTIPTGLLDSGTYAFRLHVVRESRGQSPTGGTRWRGHAVSTAWLKEYLRVEPLSSVLTLAVASGTLLTAIATLVLALTR